MGQDVTAGTFSGWPTSSGRRSRGGAGRLLRPRRYARNHEGASDLALVRLLARYGRGGPRRETLIGLWRILEDEHLGRYLAGKASLLLRAAPRARLGFVEHLGVRLSPREPDEAFQDIGAVRSRTLKPWRNHLLVWNVQRFILGR